jgi:predicted RNA binding protein YcfA (HicA-like mRNA interferase family)
MSSLPAFNSKDLQKALKKLGFTIDKSKDKGGHYKAKPPLTAIFIPGQRDFIIIPHTKEIYEDLRNKILREIKSFGFTKEQFLEALRK